ncbi:MAG TPA: NAD(P)/FAD-dependent oxidoreductase [Nitrospiraceae bacterium]|nr:NAD(P)/FAD-dependent oxidoreductase [Nitrospiraceae bacterium]
MIDPIIIIGGGPAGLTAAYQLVQAGVRPIVLEKSGLVGGIARTESYKGFRFDMGGHRFFTKSDTVQRIWTEILGEEFLRRPRLSRIYYRGRFFHYPLQPLNVLKHLGLPEMTFIVLSYLRWRFFPHKPMESFEHFVTNRFGRRLFRTFFKTYTEKVWGIPCSELKAEWAAQRIKNLSMRTALLRMLGKGRGNVRSLIEEFSYPRLGPGMMWNAVKQYIEDHGGEVRLNTEVIGMGRDASAIRHVIIASDHRTEKLRAAHIISSMPVTEAIQKLDPPAPPDVQGAAKQLRYRDFLTVCLIVNRPSLFPDNWIYIHDPSVKVGRIQNFKNWSPDMVPDPTKSSLGLEYFCQEGDQLWTRPDSELIEIAKREVDRIGLARYADVEDGCVFRVPKAYPVYDATYREALGHIKKFVGGLENFQTVGRNGLHRYDNQDHAMLTGILAVRNIVSGERHNLWDINSDADYHEEARQSAQDASSESVAYRKIRGKVCGGRGSV